jgi:aminomethyltransferase
MPIPTAVHERTFPLCSSLNYREWAGYYTPSSYEVSPEHEYNAIRQAAALIDVSPLYKYWLAERDATRLVNRVIARDINKVAVGQVIYCCWCDEQGMS